MFIVLRSRIEDTLRILPELSLDIAHGTYYTFTFRFSLAAVMTHVGRDTHTVHTIYLRIMISLCSCKSLIKTGCSPATTVSDNRNKHKNADTLLLIFFYELTIKHPRTSAILLHIIRRSSLVAYNIIHTDIV